MLISQKTIKNNLIIILVLIAAFILRFWKVPELFYFGIDEEYQSLLALSNIKDFHLIWIGLSAGSTGFYVGPGLIYLHAFLLWISKLDPIILAYTASAIGFLTTVSLYFITKHLFDNKTALISTVLYSFLPLVLRYDRRFWNPTLTPLISILLFFCLVKSFKNGQWHILVVFFLGVAFHIHASLFIFIPVYFIVLIYQYVKVKHINFFLIIISLAIFFVIYSPLIVYDLVHNFDNLKTPLRLLQQRGQGIKLNVYYSLGFLPFFAILSGVMFNKLNSKILVTILFVYVLNSFLNLSTWSTNSGLTAKKQLIINTIQEIKSKSFYLDTDQKYLYFGGWRYLFEAYGKKPAASQADEMFGWIYPNEISKLTPKLKVIISQGNKKPKESIIKTIIVKDYKSYILENK